MGAAASRDVFVVGRVLSVPLSCVSFVAFGCRNTTLEPPIQTPKHSGCKRSVVGYVTVLNTLYHNNGRQDTTQLCRGLLLLQRRIVAIDGILLVVVNRDLPRNCEHGSLWVNVGAIGTKR